MGTQNLSLRHRCLVSREVGAIRYAPRIGDLDTRHFCVVNLDPAKGAALREDFFRRHGIELEEPAAGFHLSIATGADGPVSMSPAWGAMEGEEAIVHLTAETFWNGSYAWVNAHCESRETIRSLHLGLDCSEPSLWGHATFGVFPRKHCLPRFIDYRDLQDWGGERP